MNRLSIFATSFLFALFFNFQVHALNCKDLFFAFPSHDQIQTKFAQNEKAFEHDGKTKTSFEIFLQIQKRVQEKLLQTSFSGLPRIFKFAISYSREQNIHIVSDQLSQNEHSKLINTLLLAGVQQQMAQIPYFLRNKYFEISVIQATRTTEVKIAYKFSNDVSFPIESQFITGFAQTSTNHIRPYNPAMPLPDDRIKPALQNQSVIQDTLATCGLASICKVLAQRNIPFNESKMLALAHSLGIKHISEILGPNPGLELSQLASLLSTLGEQLGFRVRQVLVQNPQDVLELKRLALTSVENGQIDLILNYFSPVIGRPGGGHFSPVAGLNIKTSEILVSEVNTAMNPSFWVSAEGLTKAMLPTGSNPLGRGYIVIEWFAVGRL